MSARFATSGAGKAPTGARRRVAPPAAAALALAALLLACGPRTPPADGSQAPSTTAASTPAAAASPQVLLDPCQGKIKALCSDADLAPISGQMKQVMVEAAAAVSPDGARVLVNNQQTWLEAQRVACGVGTGALTTKQENCLKAALTTRVKQSQDVVEKRGPFTFQRVEINQSAPVVQTAATDALGVAAPDAISKDIRFPRIDGDTPAIRKFNEAVRQSPRFKPTDQTEENTTYKIGYAGEDLVSVRFDTYDFTVGAATPNTSLRAVTINMRTGDPITAADVFRPGAKWADFLTTRAVRELTRQLRQEDDSARAPAPEDVRAAASSPANWLVTDKALVVLFPPLALGSGVIGVHEVAISWRDLKTYLNPNGPGPIKG